MTIQRNIPPEFAATEREADTQPHNETVFDLTDLLRIIRVRQRLILGTAAAVLIVTAIVLFNLTPLYQVKALVLLDQRQNKIVDVDAVLSGLPTDPTSIENQIQILRSRTLLGRVIDKLNLDQDPEFGGGSPSLLSAVTYYVNPLHWIGGAAPVSDGKTDKQAKRNKTIDRLLNNLTITAQGRSSAIMITFESASAEHAQTIANTIADAYVEDQLNAKFDATQKATVWLADRIQQLSGQVQAAEAAVQEYKAQNGLTETQNGSSLVDQQLGQLNGQLINARAALAEQEAKYARVVELQKSGHADDVSQVVVSPLIGQLREQETDLLRQQAEFSSKYGPRHPKMLDLANQKRNLDAKIDEEVARVVETVANDVAVARAQVNSLSGSLNQLTGTSNVENKARIRLKELEATATSSRSLYEAFVARFKESQGQEGIQTPDARIISHAELPNSPSFPDKKLTFGVAIPAGLLLGFLFAMLAERLDAGFRTVSQIERLLGIPVLTTMPEIPGLKETGEAADRVVESPMSSFAESVRGLQMGLIRSNVDKRPKVILVTSSVPDEGKTTVSISLGRLAARSGQKVVIVDGDLRRPSVANAIGLTDAKVGVVEVLSGENPLDQCLVKDPRTPALVLPTHRSASSAPDLLGSVAMENLIAGLKSHNDLVIIDSAPLLPVNDTKVLARLADAVVFVVRWEKTPREAVVNAARALSDINAPVAGVALARANFDRFHYYSYGYQDYYGYNKYYAD